VLRERLNQVEERIQNAVKRARRERSDVTAGCRHQEVFLLPWCLKLQLGLRHFGENLRAGVRS